MEPIKNTRALRQAIAGGARNFRLFLNGGAYSRKSITVCKDGRFRVNNHIDNSYQTLTGRQLYTQSNIGKGMKYNSFSAETPEDY